MKPLIKTLLLLFSIYGSAQSLTDTLKVDIDGKGLEESIYFIDYNNCKQLRIIGGDLLDEVIIGCENPNQLIEHEDFGWVEYWKIFTGRKTYEIYFEDNGDIAGDRAVTLQNDGVYVGKLDPSGGGIITFLDGKLTWIHQAD
ncbi:hypothetical protein [Ekhidna sp.]